MLNLLITKLTLLSTTRLLITKPPLLNEHQSITQHRWKAVSKVNFFTVQSTYSAYNIISYFTTLSIK